MGNDTIYKTGMSKIFLWMPAGVAISLGMIQFATGQSILFSFLLTLFVGVLIYGINLGIATGICYAITKTELKYTRFGITKEIQLNKIRIVQNSDLPMSGNHPAFGNDGLLIHHGQGGLLYISPKRKKEFVKNLLEANDKIVYIE